MNAESKLPLRIATITEATSQKVFERGESYYHQGSIRNPRRQGNQLQADCLGSQLYDTSVTLNPDGTIAIFDCTCPYDWGGLCKHQVALLLTYARHPEQFQAIAPPEDFLEQCSRDELLAIAKRLLQYDPALYDIARLTVPQGAQSRKTRKIRQSSPTVDLSAFQQQVARALDVDWETSTRQVTRALETALAIADESLTAGKFVQAGEMYRIFLAAMNAAYTNESPLRELDYDGDLAILVNQACEQLGECLLLATAATDGERQAWLEVLWQSFCKDAELGGIEYARESFALLCEQPTEAEWNRLEIAMRQYLATLPDGDVWQQWPRQKVANLLQARYQQNGRDEAAQQAIRELGTPDQRAEAALAAGDYEEAVAIALEHQLQLPGWIRRFADKLLAANQPELALQVVLASQPHCRPSVYQAWLERYYRTYPISEQAIEDCLGALLDAPDFERYQQLQRLAEQHNSWPTVRDRALSELTTAQQYALLVEIALAEANHPQARTWAQQLPSEQQQPALARIAKQSKAEQPEVAIACCQDLAALHLQDRNRSAYKRAIVALQTAQRLAASAGRQTEWQADFDRLVAEHRRLTAFQEELRRAKLI